ncbi:hypothetical protein ACFSUD_13015 [Sulfitobacter aestuarii]|uniref:Uncharacterized protein n=1 Tax=Sulfitobacter aestuarii TaxID=2161676 RepID=A0ABW5U5K3_9RHOB
MTQKRTKGPDKVKSLENLTLAQVYPRVSGDTNLNCCGDPDCGNYGIEPAPAKHAFVGRGSAERRLKAAMADPAVAHGVGRYKMEAESGDNLHRETDAFEFTGDPRAWNDGRVLICQHLRGNSECGVRTRLISNEAYEEERHRLWVQNGALEGPCCGNCGTGYLEKPEEFIFNGANGKPSRKVGHKKGSVPRARFVRVIHKPCKGLPGSRFTVSSEHRRQKKRDENIEILSLLANGAGLHDIRRILRTPRGETEPGMSRLYDRIFWLERTLLAYEQAQLAEWRKGVERQRIKDGKPYTHTRIAHDDIVMGVNWQTKIDRKITQLNCSVSADIRSGYVFRCDVDFDPTIDPLEVIEDAYFCVARGATLRKQYRNSKGTFTAPLLHFQRPTARFDEPALFSAAEKRLRHFVGRTAKAFDAAGEALSPEAYMATQAASARADEIEHLRDQWFNFVKHERDSRNAFDGVMTRDTYTKAASLACLKWMIPSGKLTLVGEKEGQMARVVPHIFREEILADRFEWAVIGFRKDAPIDRIREKQAQFSESLAAWCEMHPDLAPWEALQSWTSSHLSPAFRTDPNDQSRSSWVGPNLASAAFPRLWVNSPIQTANEIDKTVGFPILSPRYRAAYRRLGIDDEIDDPELRAAITRRVIHATIQPTSTFMNAIRERVSIIQRAGGRSSRLGASYINGAAYNPRVLIALMNIWRVHYNFFDWRPYRTPLEADASTAEGPTTDATEDAAHPAKNGEQLRRLAVPGTDKVILVPKRRADKVIRTTPAMRMGVHKPSQPKDSGREEDSATEEETSGGATKKKRDRRRDDRPHLPDLARILYQPWLFHGTPMWAKLQGR